MEKDVTIQKNVAVEVFQVDNGLAGNVTTKKGQKHVRTWELNYKFPVKWGQIGRGL